MSLQQILNNGYSGLKNILLIEISEGCSAIADTLIAKICNQYKDNLVKRYVADKNFSYQELIDANGVGSLFGEKTLAIIKYNNTSRPTQDHLKELDVLSNCLLSEDRVIEKLIILCEKFEYKQKKSKTYTGILQYTDVVLVSDSRIDLMLWVRYVLLNYRLEIDSKALEYLLNLNTNNIQQLSQIVLQLAYFHYQSSVLEKPYSITLDDINNFVTDNSKYNIFLLSQAYLQSDMKAMLKIFQELNSSPESAILILWMMTDDVRKLLAIKAILQDNPRATAQTISTQLHIWGDRVGDLLTASRRLSYQKLLLLFNELAKLDLIQKGVITGIGDELLQCLLKFEG